jgi:hypothetical protein
MAVHMTDKLLESLKLVGRTGSARTYRWKTFRNKNYFSEALETYITLQISRNRHFFHS